jgi:hypothetical protein
VSPAQFQAESPGEIYDPDDDCCPACCSSTCDSRLCGGGVARDWKNLYGREVRHVFDPATDASKQGEACAKSILTFAFGDATVTTAKNKAGITPAFAAWLSSLSERSGFLRLNPRSLQRDLTLFYFRPPLKSFDQNTKNPCRPCVGTPS